MTKNVTTHHFATKSWVLFLFVFAIGCRNTPTDIEDYVHSSISIEEFQFDKSINVTMGRRFALQPGLHDVLFKFSGDESIYDLAAKPEISVRQSIAEGTNSNSAKFVYDVTKIEVSGETIVVISSSILIDSSLREKIFFDIRSIDGTLIVRKTIRIRLDEKRMETSSN